MKIATVEEGNRRLLVVAALLESLPPERFNYSVWVGGGIIALRPPDDGPGRLMTGALVTVFGLSWNEAGHLFYPRGSEQDATPRQVAEKFRTFVERRQQGICGISGVKDCNEHIHRTDPDFIDGD